jgi:hypothetical protein
MMISKFTCPVDPVKYLARHSMMSWRFGAEPVTSTKTPQPEHGSGLVLLAQLLVHRSAARACTL